MYWTLQNLQDSENKQYILHYSSIFSAATVYGRILCFYRLSIVEEGRSSVVPGAAPFDAVLEGYSYECGGVTRALMAPLDITPESTFQWLSDD
jgi:hypothetical protein